MTGQSVLGVLRSSNKCSKVPAQASRFVKKSLVPKILWSVAGIEESSYWELKGQCMLIRTEDTWRRALSACARRRLC